MQHTNEYLKIDQTLFYIENHKYSARDVNWCSDRVAWAWRWKKITRDEMEELASRVIAVYDAEANRRNT